MTKYPFEASYAEIESNLDPYVDAVFSSLQSAFMVMPQGSGFVDYPVFEKGYQNLKKASNSFTKMEPAKIMEAVLELPIVLIVLRSILGFTPPEWAYVASQDAKRAIDQGQVRALDRLIRTEPMKTMRLSASKQEWIRCLVDTACRLIKEGAPEVPEKTIHRLNKADTCEGLKGVQSMSDLGVPYAMLLYERLLGRPFAGHRDSVSEHVGDVIETAIEVLLHKSGIQFRKTKRAEKVTGFDQAPDFIIPDEFSPQVVIEAKLTEDDGTARDKITRVQHLCELSQVRGVQKFEVIACIDGRGFGIRREDMKKLLRCTRGKVFTGATLEHLVEHSKLRDFATK
jgi:hypothetical protein